MFCCGGLTIKYVRFLFPPPTLCLAYQLSISSDLLIPENISALDPNLFISKLHHSIFVLSAKVNICVTIQNNPIPFSLLLAPTKRGRLILSRSNGKQNYPFLPMAKEDICTEIGVIKSRQVRCPKPRCSAVKQAPEQLVLGNWHMFHVLAATVGLLTFLASFCASTCKQRYNGSCHSSFDYLYPKSESKEKSCANICFTLDSPTLYFAFVLSRLGYVICPLV